ncbi:predicted protein [Phaeodactylum tricornutum CCAP 1055/1]|jgi:hypothetical protein|uniref:Replication factor A protein 3 n=3 Tax=Phaeodactylum tricornutum TaxID=2850 RepID=B7FZW4_PHATC|nr:predicted protein [Phaeodactylum tricornutum CCAP 1055/1]EEC47783.1 predicted protein [Phaeodactylum tricornutum CCAP 1055/1]|eukprot:XP_002180375.1 predicted protein [Phaeodactylum tricornutum CCAP 1055/1]
MAEQPQGSYPRINGKMLQSGVYNDQLVSLMGRFVSMPNPDATVSFQCADQVVVTLSTEHAEVPPLDMIDGPVVEIVGQVATGQDPLMMFVVRELSKDLDLDVYNQMIEVQQNPKFQNYFAPIQA